MTEDRWNAGVPGESGVVPHAGPPHPIFMEWSRPLTATGRSALLARCLPPTTKTLPLSSDFFQNPASYLCLDFPFGTPYQSIMRVIQLIGQRLNVSALISNRIKSFRL